MELQKVKERLLTNELFIFAGDYGTKVNAESWTVRKSKQVKKLDQFKEFQNTSIQQISPQNRPSIFSAAFLQYKEHL